MKDSSAAPECVLIKLSFSERPELHRTRQNNLKVGLLDFMTCKQRGDSGLDRSSGYYGGLPKEFGNDKRCRQTPS